MRLLFVLPFLLCSFFLNAQAKIDSARKVVAAIRTTAKFTIDGEMKEVEWINAPMASDFIEWRPTFGNKEDAKTELRLKFCTITMVSILAVMPTKPVKTALVRN